MKKGLLWSGQKKTSSQDAIYKVLKVKEEVLVKNGWNGMVFLYVISVVMWLGNVDLGEFFFQYMILFGFKRTNLMIPH